MIHAPANRVRSSSQRGGAALRATVCAIIATVIPSAAHAQSTWLPTSGTFSWLSSGSWSNSTVPNATGAVAVFTTGGVTASIPTATVTTGTIRTTNASGNVVIGDTATTTDILNLDVASGVPTIDVGTGGLLFMYANVTGSQGFTKTGAGTLSFRFNPHNMAYTGTVTLNQGTLGLNQDGSLGDTSNPLSVTGNSTLLIAPGSNSGTVAFAAGRTMTIASSVTSTVQNNNAAQTAVFNNPIGGSGALVLNTGTFTLNGNNTYAGATTLTNVNRLTLGNGSRISSAGLTVTTPAAATFGTVIDLGGNAQSVSSLAFTTGTSRVTSTITNGSLNVTGGNLTLNSGTTAAVTGTQTYDFSGLSSFTYNNAAGTFAATVSATTAALTGQTLVNLANAGNSGTNTITALNVNIGNSGANNATNSTVIGLGKFNTFNSGTMQVGFFQGSGTMGFQSGVSNGVLTLRGTAGGSSSMDTFTVGYNNSGNRTGQGTLNLAGGTLDARVTTLNVGFSLQTVANSSSLVMGSGTVVAGLINLGGGNNLSTASFTQSAGEVTANSLLFGGTAVAGTPNYVLTYNLNGGTLRSGTIATNLGTFSSTTSRTVAWTAGTISNLDGSTDLVVNGTTGAGGLLSISLGGTATKSLAADAGRTITLGANTLVSSTGSLTVNGPGTVVINGSNTYSGGTTLSAGTLRAGNANAFGSGGVTVASNATLDLNALAVGSAITNNGGTVSNAANYAGSQTLNGASVIGDLGGTLVVANGGNATFGGALAAATTINAGGNGTLNNAGSISAAGLTNNGTFTIDRTGSSSLATIFSGNGTLVKAGAGIVSLSGSSNFSGATQVNAGDLRVDGSLAGGVAVAANAILGGTGSVGTVSGAGLIGPGNSPGVLTATDVNPTGGLSFAFEFTQAAPLYGTPSNVGNDLFWLTGGTPFTTALNGSNTVNIYMTQAAAELGTLTGGFYTTNAVDFLASINSASFQYYVADANGSVTYNGQTYTTLTEYDSSKSVTISTVGANGGQVMQMVVVPEPGALAIVATGALAAGWTTLRRIRRR